MKAELILRSPDRHDTFPLTGERITVGRGMSAHIRINDQLLSREHCEVLRRGDRWVVRDMGSSNGTRVNGQALTEKVLEWGDKIEVGETTLLFVSEQPQTKGLGDLDMTPSAKDDSQTKCFKGSEIDVKAASQEKSAGEYMSFLYEIETQAAAKTNVPEFCQTVLKGVLRSRRFGRAALLIFDAKGEVTDRFTRVEKEHSKWRIHVDPRHLSKVHAGDLIQGRGERVEEKDFKYMIVPVRGEERVYGALYMDDLIAMGELPDAELPLLAAVGRVMGLRMDEIFERQRRRVEGPTVRQIREDKTPPAGTQLP